VTLPNPNIVFVTGTDTGVGKTVVSCALAQSLRAEGVGLKVMKPVETGCSEQDNGELHAQDAQRLLANAESHQAIEEVVPYRYRTPVAPNVAAEIESRPIDLKQLIENIQTTAKSCELLIVEGAGGLMVPLVDGYSFADLSKELGASTVLVIGSRLGCINHSLLSIELLRSRGITTFGYALSEVNSQGMNDLSEGPAIGSNRETLRKVSASYGLTELAYLPFQSEIWGKDGLTCSQAVISSFGEFSDAIIEHFRLKR